MITTDALKYLPQAGLDPSGVVGCTAAKCQNSLALANGFCRQIYEGALPRHEEKITMSTKITMALIAVVTALTCPALDAGNGNRGHAYKSAQYCIPQYEDLSDVTRVYC